MLEPAKTLALTSARYLPSGDPVEGYEIHLGQTTGPDRDRAWLAIGPRTDGAASPDGRVQGTYLHGLFSSDAFRHAYLAQLGAPVSDTAYDDGVDAALDALADHLETHLDLDTLLALASTA